MINMCPQYQEFLYKRDSIICTGCHVTNIANKPLVSVSVFDMRVPGNSVLHWGVMCWWVCSCY